MKNGVVLDLAALLAHLGELVRFGRGETIYLLGSPSGSLYVIDEGHVKLDYLDESGKNLTFALLRPGEIFGELCLLGEETRRQHSAIAVDEAVLRRIDMATVSRAVGNDPEFLRVLLRHLACRMGELEEALQDMAFKDITQRLARLLLKLARRHGIRTEEGILIGLQLTHKNLADMIGAARENVTSVLNGFERDGLIDKSRYSIVITNRKDLKGIANPEPRKKGDGSEHEIHGVAVAAVDGAAADGGG